jgi:EAL domain-containing protein (putative c-di-GMP-specific phosphodiesterase class I)
VLDELDAAIETLDAIRNLGVRLAIDDFGTGYSSLSYLRRLPVDTVKIDRTFTTELNTDHNDVTIVAGIIGLARGLGLQVVAEGVETERQAEILIELGCTQAQGYLYSPPVALDDLLRLYHPVTESDEARH